MRRPPDGVILVGNMMIREVMSSPAHACTPNTSLADAARKMREFNCGALPVVDPSHRPVGILTDRDVCLAIARERRSAEAIFVREIMTVNPITAEPTRDFGYALNLMASSRVRRLPVVDEKGILVGILTLDDVIAAMWDAPESDTPLLRRLVRVCRNIVRQGSRPATPGQPPGTQAPGAREGGAGAADTTDRLG